VKDESYEQMIGRHKQWFYDWAFLFLYFGCVSGTLAALSVGFMIISAVSFVFSGIGFYLSVTWK